MSVKSESRAPAVSESISSVFSRAHADNRAAFLPFITAGYPNLEESYRMLEIYANAGSDIIEIGVPFSDPLADGPTVQHSSQVALEQGTTVQDALDLVARFRGSGFTTPIVLMGYSNPFHKFGLERLAEESARAGVNGFIIPDLPAEECDEFRVPLMSHGVGLIFMVAPTTTDDRLETIASLASEFIYCVSLTGTTGARHSLSETLPEYLARVRRFTDLPLAVGFGVSTPEQVEAVSRVADGVIVASAILNLYDSSADNPLGAVESFVGELVQATSR